MIAFLDLNWPIVSGNCVKYIVEKMSLKLKLKIEIEIEIEIENVFEIECIHREILQRSFCRIQQLCNYCNSCANICFISFYRF